MLNIPVKNPRTVQLITVGLGIVALLVAHFWPNYSILLSQILNVLGVGAMGVGAAQITTKAPEAEKVDDTVSIIPGGPLLVLLFLAFAVHQQGCASKPLPCDESKLRAIDAAYLLEVGKHCLQYSSAAECPDLPELRAKHSRDLKASCP